MAYNYNPFTDEFDEVGAVSALQTLLDDGTNCQDNIYNLNNHETAYEVHQVVTGNTSGVATIYPQASVIFGGYENGRDALIVPLDAAGKTYDAYVFDANGDKVFATLDALGNWTCTGLPVGISGYALVFQLKIKLKYADNIPLSALTEKTEYYSKEEIYGLRLVDSPQFENLLIGANASFNNYAAKAIFSNGNLGASIATTKIGAVGEAVSTVDDYALGLYGIASIFGNKYGRGIAGIANVTVSQAVADAIGVDGISTDTHAGGKNVAIRANAANGATNYSFYGIAGQLYNGGKVGIGVTNPSYWLDLSSTDSVQARLISTYASGSTAGAVLELMCNDGAALVLNDVSGTIYFGGSDGSVANYRAASIRYKADNWTAIDHRGEMIFGTGQGIGGIGDIMKIKYGTTNYSLALGHFITAPATNPTKRISLANIGYDWTVGIEDAANNGIGYNLTLNAQNTLVGGTSDLAGGNMIYYAGKNKGTGGATPGGNHIWYYSTVTTTGTTLGSHTEGMRLAYNGNLGIGLGTGVVPTYRLDISSADSTNLRVTSTAASGSSAGVVVDLVCNDGAALVNSDRVGIINFKSLNSTPSLIDFASIEVTQVSSVIPTSPTTELNFKVRNTVNNYTYLKIKGGNNAVLWIGDSDYGISSTSTYTVNIAPEVGSGKFKTIGVNDTSVNYAGNTLRINAGNTSAGTISDLPGGNLELNAGLNKGTGGATPGGNCILKYSTVVASGTTLGTLTEGLRLNFNGDLKFVRGKSIIHAQSQTTDTDSDWRTYADANGYYIQKRISGSWTTIQEFLA